jgi:glycine/D-amino acid oxidase-like deaminating enzyme
VTGVRLLTARESMEKVGVANTLAGGWHPHCAAVNPAKLVSGLAAVVESLGVQIFEQTRVSEIRPRRAMTAHGSVSADFVVRATEGFTAGLKGEHRTWLPMNSSLVVTEPLSESVWHEIGWGGRDALGDFAHIYMYAQRTADNRIALGGRGAPYRYGSRTDTDGQTRRATIEGLHSVIAKFFPAAADAAIDHAWSGVLGVPRDWAATIGLDPASGLAWAGGYVGTGVTTTNLAGRTLTDLILGRETSLTALPWVNHSARRWEFEPLRWLAVHGIYAAYGLADRAERNGRATTPAVARVADFISGRS